MSNILKIERGERAIVIGATGSGKSTLCQELVRPLPFCIAIDPKGEFDIPGKECIILEKFQDVVEKSNYLVKHNLPDPLIIYRPIPTEAKPEGYDKIYSFVYQRGNCSVYTDELSAVVDTNGTPTEYLNHIQMRGRSKGITAVHAVQRPTRIPLVTLSEAQRYYCFELTLKADKTRICDIIGIQEFPIMKRFEFLFWYSKKPLEIIQTKLKLTKGA